MSRTHKHSCGCAMCKPHKHGLEPKYRPSERRKIDDPRKQLREMYEAPYLDQEDAWDDEMREAIYCHEYGPCERCLAADKK